MSDETKIKTSIYLPESIHWALKESAVKRRLSDTVAMQQAIEFWLQSGEMYAALERALNSGDKEAIKQIELALKPFMRSAGKTETRAEDEAGAATEAKAPGRGHQRKRAG